MAHTTIQKESFGEINGIPQGSAFNRIQKKSLSAIFPQGESLIRNMQGASGVNVTHASVATPTFTQTNKRKCTSTSNAVKVRKGAQGKNSTCLNTVISNNDTDEFAFNLDFIAQEIEPPNKYFDISDTDMVFEQQQVNVVADENRNASPSVTIDCISDRMLQDRGKNGNQNCAQSAVELMRIKIGILREQAVFNKQIQERRNEIEEEKLKILRENVAFKKSKV